MDLLVKNESLELLLVKHVVVDEEGKRELQLALYHFLKTNYPSDDKNMKLVLLRFGMFREYAEMLYEKATNKLNMVLPKNGHLSVTLLLDIMEKFLEAAENYQKANAFHLAQECYQKAELIGLQVENPDTLYLNLEKGQVRQLMMYLGIFEHSLILAQAYNLNDLSEWIGPIYYQVIENGNFEFLSDFSGLMPLSNQFFSDIVRKYKSSPKQSKTNVVNLKTFLLFMDDHYLRYEIANSLGADFKDITTNLQNLTGLSDWLAKSNQTKSPGKTLVHQVSEKSE